MTEKKVIRKFWRIKRHFFRKSLLFFRKNAIFSKNFPKTYRNLTLGFLGCFLLHNLGFSIFFEWQHCPGYKECYGLSHMSKKMSQNNCFVKIHGNLQMSSMCWNTLNICFSY